MRFRWLSAAVCTATLGLAAFTSPNLCQAQATKSAPKAAAVAEEDDDGAVVVVALNAIDSLVPNIQHVARLVGAGAASGGITTVLNQFSGGLDRTRPLGVFVNLDESGTPSPVGCLPIEDLEQFFDQLSAFGEPNDLGDGLYEFSFGNTVYAKKVGKWLYVAQTEDALEDISETLGDSLPKIIQKYDVRLQINPQNIPEELVEFFIGQVQAGLDQGMAQGNMDADEAESARATSEQMIAQMKEGIEGTEKVIVGLAVNKQDKKTVLDFGSQFVKDSKFAKQIEKFKTSKATMAGIPQEASLMSLQTFQLVAPEEVGQMEKTLEAGLKTAFKSIDEGAKDPASAAKAKELIEKAVDILVESAKLGKVESAVDVSVDSANTLSIVSSVGVADGSKVESLAAELATEIAKEKLPVQIKLNTGKHAGFNLHNASITLPPNAAAAAKKMFGNAVTIAIATSPKMVHVAVGKNCDAAIKSAIDRGAAKPSAPAEMVKMKLVLSQLLNYINSIEANPVSEAMLNAASGGSDRISIDSQTTERGAVVRLSLEDGVLKAIAAGVKAGQSGGGF